MERTYELRRLHSVKKVVHNPNTGLCCVYDIGCGNTVDGLVVRDIPLDDVDREWKDYLGL